MLVSVPPLGASGSSGYRGLVLSISSRLDIGNQFFVVCDDKNGVAEVKRKDQEQLEKPGLTQKRQVRPLNRLGRPIEITVLTILQLCHLDHLHILLLLLQPLQQRIGKNQKIPSTMVY